MTKRPNSRVNLDKAIMRLFGSYDKSLETRDIIANAIVGQMLCGAVVKGGSGLKLRYGMSCTRATVDLDTACSGDIPQFIDMLAARLKEGWNDFTGEVVRRNPATPRAVPQQYGHRRGGTGSEQYGDLRSLPAGKPSSPALS